MTHPTPEPGSYEARHPTPVQKSAATRAANAARYHLLAAQCSSSTSIAPPFACITTETTAP